VYVNVLANSAPLPIGLIETNFLLIPFQKQIFFLNDAYDPEGNDSAEVYIEKGENEKWPEFLTYNNETKTATMYPDSPDLVGNYIFYLVFKETHSQVLRRVECKIEVAHYVAKKTKPQIYIGWTSFLKPYEGGLQVHGTMIFNGTVNTEWLSSNFNQTFVFKWNQDTRKIFYTVLKVQDLLKQFTFKIRDARELQDELDPWSLQDTEVMPDAGPDTLIDFTLFFFETDQQIYLSEVPNILEIAFQFDPALAPEYFCPGLFSEDMCDFYTLVSNVPSNFTESVETEIFLEETFLVETYFYKARQIIEIYLMAIVVIQASLLLYF
jgi:hypothetical protein